MRWFSLDIETLATPENSGYGIVVPNYAIVQIPENYKDALNWLYVQLPIQPQLDLGLKTDASTMNFWFNLCAKEFPNSLLEMQKSFTLEIPHIIANGVEISPEDVTGVVKTFLHGSLEIDRDVKVFGNGCQFDCSILQENHRVSYNEGNLWNYVAPNNIRTLRLLLTKEEDKQMRTDIEPYLEAFCEVLDEKGYMEKLALHNPVYDAAKESLFASWILERKKSS